MTSKYGQQLYGKDLYSSAITQFEGTCNFVIATSGRLNQFKTLIGSVSFTVATDGRIAEFEFFQGNLVSFTVTPTSIKLTKLDGFRGIIPFTVFSTAWITESEPLSSQISILVSLSGRLTESEPLQATPLSFALTTVPSHLIEYEFLQGNLSILWTFSGKLLDINYYRGLLSFAPVLSGELFRSSTRFLEGGLPIALILSGRLTESKPLIATQTTFSLAIGGGVDIYLGPFWGPDKPDVDGWVPDTPTGGFWSPDEPKNPFWEPIPRSG